MSRRKMFWVVAVLAVIAVLAVAGTATLLSVRDQVAPGTHIAGIDVGGMREAELDEVIDGPLAQKLARAVTVHVAEDALAVDPASVGITLDRRATLAALLSMRPGNVFAPFRALSGEYREVTPVLTMDRTATRKALRQKLEPLTPAARSATVRTPTPTPELSAKGTTSWTATAVDVQVSPSVTGRSVKLGHAVTLLHAAVVAARTDVVLPVTTTQPAVTTAAAGRIDQLIGTFTTGHPCCAPRVTNIRRMAELVDGSMIAPGKTFSLNAASGRRTLAGGFVNAPAIAEGELVDQVGGGVSQFSTTLYNAAWFSGLDILKHQPHSKYISRYPPGREATLDYDTIDQVIENDTDVPVIIRAATTGTSVTVALYGHTGDRRVVSTTGPQNPRDGGGFSVGVQRRIIDDGQTSTTDSTSWTYTGLD